MSDAFSVPKFICLLCQKYQNTQVTDIGPKDSNFPQNAWGLLDSTAQDHIFSVIPNMRLEHVGRLVYPPTIGYSLTMYIDEKQKFPKCKQQKR